MITTTVWDLVWLKSLNWTDVPSQSVVYPSWYIQKRLPFTRDSLSHCTTTVKPGYHRQFFATTFWLHFCHHEKFNFNLDLRLLGVVLRQSRFIEAVEPKRRRDWRRNYFSGNHHHVTFRSSDHVTAIVNPNDRPHDDRDDPVGSQRAPGRHLPSDDLHAHRKFALGPGQEVGREAKDRRLCRLKLPPTKNVWRRWQRRNWRWRRRQSRERHEGGERHLEVYRLVLCIFCDLPSITSFIKDF